LDFSSTEAYYPGVPGVVISDDNNLDFGDMFLQMNQSYAFLNGTYYISRNDSGASVSVSISSTRDQNNATISKIKSAIVVTLLRNDTFAALSSAVIMPNQTAILSKAGYTGNTSVEVNGLFYYPNATQPSPPPSGAMGAFTGEAVWTSFCNVTTEHTHINTMSADTVAYGGAKYCLDLHLRSLSVNTDLTNVDVYITQKALPLDIPKVGDSSTIVYATFELSKNTIDGKNVWDSSFDFRVLKYWSENNGVPVGTVRLAKYNGVSWDTLSSSQTGENDAYYYFNSASNGLSYYVIYGSKVDIWYVLGVIDKYYHSTASFLDVLDAISKYYA
jgi:PGF-pre-PGF domain-containing protein